ncbi:hypothetical protein Tco_0982538 [Tanacetum coccineum]
MATWQGIPAIAFTILIPVSHSPSSSSPPYPSENRFTSPSPMGIRDIHGDSNVKGKGKAIMKDEKQKLTGIKEVDDLEQRIKNLKVIFSYLRDKKLKQKEVVVKSEDDKYLDDDKSSDDDTSKDSQDYLSEDSSKDLINFLSSRDLEWQFPKQKDTLQKIASSSRGTNTRGEPRYGLRSFRPIQEEIAVVKKPYSLVKVTNVVLGLRAPKAEVGCSGSGRKRNS